MKGGRTVGRYRIIDVLLFAAILTVFEALAVTASLRWFPQEAYAVSMTAAVTAIVMMRWGPWAALHAVLGGAVHVWCAQWWSGGAGAQPFIIWCAGNLAGLGALGLIRALGAERIRQSDGLTLLCGGAAQLLMQLGRAGVGLLCGLSPQDALLLISMDVVSLLFTLVVLWIARRLDGVFENQEHYLTRLHRQLQQEEEGGSQ